ncbi:MAG TPA: biotin/lipoyl-containing protein [Chloroflexota bacterium]|nr:biotin/lipoyl-containing protein [Chloroflexota bacterium]
MVTYQVTIGERTLRVSLRRESDALFARVDDGVEIRVQLDAVRGPLHTLLLDGRRTEVLARRDAAAVQLSIGGIGYRAEVLDEAHARLAQVTGARGGAHSRRELKAPMPGLVVKVLAEPGQDVEPHQPLVVLQAMKMENELALPRAGRVSAVNVQSGQTVEAGQVLIALEE